MTEIIGLSGFARAGKDETARVLIEEYGFTRVAFADKLREFLYALDPIVYGRGSFVPLHYVIDNYGWDGYKETEYCAEIRRLLQRLGTEAGRQTLWDTIWIDAAFKGVDSDKIVVTDCRFYNEFEAIRDRGGKIWRVNRPGVGPANEHASEMEAVNYPNFSVVMSNDSTLEGLTEKVKWHYEVTLTKGI